MLKIVSTLSSSRLKKYTVPRFRNFFYFLHAHVSNDTNKQKTCSLFQIRARDIINMD